MPASPLDSAIFGDLMGDADVARLFTDSAHVRAMLIVEGALAQAQGARGVIPEISAKAIHRASLEVQIDPTALASGAAASAVPVPALVAAFRKAMDAPEHAAWVHFGATSQDILDTALTLRLRQVLKIFDDRLSSTLTALAALADQHATLPMAARTYGQAATPTSFGALASSWGRPLLRSREALPGLRERVLAVSLSGAAGTLSAMGRGGPEIRKALAEALDLQDPGESWHAERDRMAELSAWLVRITGALGRMGEDLVLLTQTGIGEVRLGQGGSSSTMPQKSNPVLPSLLGAIARQANGLDAVMQGAMIHRQQRDAAAWMTEWMSLPQLCILAARALSAAGQTLAELTPVPEAMAANLDDGRGLIYAEALTFALARHMPRPEAEAAVKDMIAAQRDDPRHLRDLAAARFPDRDLTPVFDPVEQLGQAPDEARAFAAALAPNG